MPRVVTQIDLKLERCGLCRGKPKTFRCDCRKVRGRGYRIRAVIRGKEPQRA